MTEYEEPRNDAGKVLGSADYGSEASPANPRGKLIRVDFGNRTVLGEERLRDGLEKRVASQTRLDEIVRTAAVLSDYGFDEIKGRSTRGGVSDIRALAIYAATELLGDRLSLEDFGKYFGRHHTAVMYGRDSFKRRISRSREKRNAGKDEGEDVRAYFEQLLEDAGFKTLSWPEVSTNPYDEMLVARGGQRFNYLASRVAAHAGLEVGKLFSKDRHKKVASARHVLVKMASELFPWMNRIDLGMRMGGRDHTTIINSLEAFEFDKTDYSEMDIEKRIMARLDYLARN